MKNNDRFLYGQLISHVPVGMYVVVFLVLHIPLYKTSLGQMSFLYMAVKDWNSLPNEIRLAKTLDRFKFMVYKHFLELDTVSYVCSIIK